MNRSLFWLTALLGAGTVGCSDKDDGIEDSESDDRTRTFLESYRFTQIRSVICVPLLKAGRLVAALSRARLVVDMRDAWPDLLADAGAGIRHRLT